MEPLGMSSGWRALGPPGRTAGAHRPGGPTAAGGPRGGVALLAGHALAFRRRPLPFKLLLKLIHALAATGAAARLAPAYNTGMELGFCAHCQTLQRWVHDLQAENERLTQPMALGANNTHVIEHHRIKQSPSSPGRRRRDDEFIEAQCDTVDGKTLEINPPHAEVVAEEEARLGPPSVRPPPTRGKNNKGRGRPPPRIVRRTA